MWEGVYLTVYIYNDNADWYFQWNLFFINVPASLLMLWMFINCQINNAFLCVLFYGNHLILYAYYILIDKSEKKNFVWLNIFVCGIVSLAYFTSKDIFTTFLSLGELAKHKTTTMQSVQNEMWFILETV